jgi:hypothetical protein
MIKIDRNYIIGFFILAVVFFSLHPILTMQALPLELFLVYAIVFTAVFFLAGNIKTEKGSFYYTLLFTMGAAFIGAGQYIFSFFDQRLVLYGAELMAAGGLMLAAAEIKFRQKAAPGSPATGVKGEAILLAAVFIASFILRYWDLSNFLPGIWFDEAQNGNETQSLIETGKPVVFVAGYTHMPAMYFYLASVFVKALGLNIFPLRLVSCVLGSLSVVAFYFLAKQVFRDWRSALLAAFLLAFSRIHITFSRVAFLGMQTVFLEILFFYFYFKFLERKSAVLAAVAGLLLGLAQYTFSAANFILITVILHSLYLAAKNILFFWKNYLAGFVLMAAVSLIIAAPLIDFAIRSPQEFFQRAGDVSIMKDIKDFKSLEPIARNLKAYALCFNFEGDYNGRHNLYKKPMLDTISGVFFVLGLVVALCRPGFWFFPFWMFVMALPGILTLTIESPQFYRILGLIPAAYILITLGIKTAADAVAGLSGKKHAAVVFMLVSALSAGAASCYQYFYLYPRTEGTYMSFSPEANGIAKLILEKSRDYFPVITTARNMYGFYMWEQSVIVTFLTQGKANFYYLYGSTAIDERLLAGKRGIMVVTRPTDTDERASLERQYAGRIARTEDYRNPYSGDIMYTCHYIEMDKIFRKTDKIIFIK